MNLECNFRFKAIEVVVFFYDWAGKEKDRKATYTVLNITEDKIHAEIVKLEYPGKSVREAIYESEIPDFFYDFLSNN